MFMSNKFICMRKHSKNHTADAALHILALELKQGLSILGNTFLEKSINNYQKKGMVIFH
jgi:hypothetical protein